jgi:hypothetical protein
VIVWGHPVQPIREGPRVPILEMARPEMLVLHLRMCPFCDPSIEHFCQGGMALLPSDDDPTIVGPAPLDR